MPSKHESFLFLTTGSLTSSPPQILVPNEPHPEGYWGTLSPHNSPGITAIPTEQGIIGTLQEIEVPFGNQRPQRRHVTTQTLSKHMHTSHTCRQSCVPEEVTQTLLGIPPVFYEQFQNPESPVDTLHGLSTKLGTCCGHEVRIH